MEKTKVFVTDTQMRSSLTVICSLGENGLNRIAGDKTKFTTGFFKKLQSFGSIREPMYKTKVKLIKKNIDGHRSILYAHTGYRGFYSFSNLS